MNLSIDITQRLSLTARNARNEADNLPTVRAYWRTPRVHLQRRIVLGLEGWRRVVRIHGAVIGICALLALIGLGLARDARERRSGGVERFCTGRLGSGRLGSDRHTRA